MYKYSIRLSLLVLFITSCNTDNRTETEKKLTGQWESLSIKVEINSGDKATRMLEVSRDNWEEKLKIQPIITVYKADSTYSSEYKDLEGKTITTNKGTWLIKNKNLVMKESEPRKETFKYSVEFTGDTVLLKGEIDWDLDGKKDDKYEGRSIKVLPGDK